MMIITIALHKPKGQAEEANFSKSLKEYGDIQRKYKGHELYAVGKDEKTGVLTVVSLWGNQEDMIAAREEMLMFRKKFDFQANQVGPTRYFQGNAEFVEISLK
jgi:hypothetical protein